MKKHCFLFFIILFASYFYADSEVVDYVNFQHQEIFSFLSENKDQLQTNEENFLSQFEKKFSKLIPPNEISKRVMGKKYFTQATQDQIVKFNEKFKNTLLDSYSGALSNV